MSEENIIYGVEYERVIDSALGELALMLLRAHGNTLIMMDAFTEEKLTANLLLDQAIRIAKFFKSKKIGYGDTISVISENRLEFAIIPVAAFFVGATFAPLNPDYTLGELQHILNLSKPKIVFCSSKTIDKMVNLQKSHSHIEELVIFGKSLSNYSNVLFFNELVKGATGQNVDKNFQSTIVNPKETIATILCSSGTTGMPKGVMCTHDNMTNYIDIIRSIVAPMFENQENNALLGLTPFFHSFGFMMMFLNVLRGNVMIVMSKFNIKSFLDAVCKYRIVRLVAPPAVMITLLKHPLIKHYDLSFVKEIRTGAAPLGKHTEMELNRAFKTSHVSQAYGMTETTLGVLITPYNKAKLGSVGTIVPGMKAKIIDENGKCLGPFQTGELCFKGPLIMKGYVNDEKATAETIIDGWLHTGDIAYYDNDKYFFIVDRLKELIKYKGFQVAPAELESILLTHPAIEDAAVVGLEDDEAGELPLGFVVRKPNCVVSEIEIQTFIAKHVSPQKKLRGGVVFIKSIPRNPAGKILRRQLREQAKQLKSKL